MIASCAAIMATGKVPRFALAGCRHYVDQTVDRFA
jgi:hypothetical protein